MFFRREGLTLSSTIFSHKRTPVILKERPARRTILWQARATKNLKDFQARQEILRSAQNDNEKMPEMTSAPKRPATHLSFSFCCGIMI